MPHQRGDIGAQTALLEAAEILVEVLPGALQAARHGRVEGAVVEFAIARRGRRDTAVADDLGRNALGQSAGGLALHDQREVGVGVDVDEARGDELAGGVNGLRRLQVRQLANAGDAPVGDRHIGGEPGSARAVDHAPVADNEIALHCTISRGESHRRKNRLQSPDHAPLRIDHVLHISKETGTPGDGGARTCGTSSPEAEFSYCHGPPLAHILSTRQAEKHDERRVPANDARKP